MSKIDTKQFIRIFKDIHFNSSDRKFCFILGAGASRSSGILTGGEMAKNWIDELKECLSEHEFNIWKNKNNILHNDYASHYGEIYRKRFEHDPQSGFDYLNKSMKKAKPGFGYSVLAQLLSTTRHNIILTTNFDSLCEEALYIYSYKKFLVCGHESLSGFATPSIDRPLIAKIHRDLFLNPQNTTEETQYLRIGWEDVLNNIIEKYIPIVIGYGGNDGSLMNQLEKLNKDVTLYWCYKLNHPVSKNIEILLNNLNGFLVETDGFDDLMYEISISADLGFLNDKIKKGCDERLKEYEKNVQEILKNKSKSSKPEDKQSATDFSNMAKDETPFSYLLKILGESNTDKKEKLFKEAIFKFSDSIEIIGSYANFLSETRKKYDEAEVLYQKVQITDPDNAVNNCNYASFLSQIRKNYDEAERLFLKAIKVDPDNVVLNVNYANFLNHIRKNYDEAEKYYLKAFFINPDDSVNNESYANFLYQIRKNYDEAERLFLKAIKDVPDNAVFNGNYATFLYLIRKKYDEAEKYFIKAIKDNPVNESNNGNYANFLFLIRKKYDEAEKYYLKIFKDNPDNLINITNYANFLCNIRKDFDKAEKYYLKVIKDDPNNQTNNSIYANFLYHIRKNYDKAELYFRKVLNTNPDNVLTNGNYANFLCDVRKNYNKAEKYYQKALKSDPNNEEINVNYAGFLCQIRKNYDEAEKYFLNALKSNPNDIINNGNYANFLFDVRKNYVEAEKHYIKALKSNPTNAIINGNYAQLLFSKGEKFLGKKYLDIALENSYDLKPLQLRLWFYVYAHFLDNRIEASKKIEDLLNNEVRSFGWDFTTNIEQAIKENHPDVNKLKEYANKISS